MTFELCRNYYLERHNLMSTYASLYVDTHFIQALPDKSPSSSPSEWLSGIYSCLQNI